MSELQVGTIVTAHYKTGKYIGEITQIRPQHYLVRILSVLKHPMQGDLHNPKEADVAFFHERKALAYREQTNVPMNMVKSYEGEVVEYKASLEAALQKMKAELTEDGSQWAMKSIQSLDTLEKEYFI